MFHGSNVALVTPMNADGSLDVKSYKDLLDLHIQSNTDGIVVVGTTGEAPTVDFDELVAPAKLRHDQERLVLHASDVQSCCNSFRTGQFEGPPVVDGVCSDEIREQPRLAFEPAERNFVKPCPATVDD